MPWWKNATRLFLRNTSSTVINRPLSALHGSGLRGNGHDFASSSHQPNYSFSSAEPSLDADFNVFGVATNVLHRTLRKADSMSFKAWAWFSWIKRCAFAILLAELCEHTEGPRVDKAWDDIEASFAKYELVLHD
jgi:hypothetical protein